jgi:uncharacterized protein YerC
LFLNKKKNCMLKIELVPDLEHCVETLARKKHAELTQILLENEVGDAEMEEKLEVVRLFLETADFRKLRAESEKHLAEGKIVRFTIYLEDGIAKYEMLVSRLAR